MKSFVLFATTLFIVPIGLFGQEAAPKSISEMCATAMREMNTSMRRHQRISKEAYEKVSREVLEIGLAALPTVTMGSLHFQIATDEAQPPREDMERVIHRYRRFSKKFNKQKRP